MVLKEPFAWLKLFSVAPIAAGVFLLQRKGLSWLGCFPTPSTRTSAAPAVSASGVSGTTLPRASGRGFATADP
jgi:hypothetical protein